MTDPEMSPIGESPRPSVGPPWLPITIAFAYVAWLILSDLQGLP